VLSSLDRRMKKKERRRRKKEEEKKERKKIERKEKKNHQRPVREWRQVNLILSKALVKEVGDIVMDVDI
jgi:hypothetical protein